MKRSDKALIIILGATTLICWVLLITQPSFEALGGTLSVTAIWLLTIGLAISTAEARLLRHTIAALLEQKATRPENQ